MAVRPERVGAAELRKHEVASRGGDLAISAGSTRLTLPARYPRLAGFAGTRSARRAELGVLALHDTRRRTPEAFLAHHDGRVPQVVHRKAGPRARDACLRARGVSRYPLSDVTGTLLPEQGLQAHRLRGSLDRRGAREALLPRQRRQRELVQLRDPSGGPRPAPHPVRARDPGRGRGDGVRRDGEPAVRRRGSELRGLPRGEPRVPPSGSRRLLREHERSVRYQAVHLRLLRRQLLLQQPARLPPRPHGPEVPRRASWDGDRARNGRVRQLPGGEPEHFADARREGGPALAGREAGRRARLAAVAGDVPGIPLTDRMR